MSDLMENYFTMQQIIFTELDIVTRMNQDLNVICPQQYIYLFIIYSNIKEEEDMVMIYYKCTYINELLMTYTKYINYMSLHLAAICFRIANNDYSECQHMKKYFGSSYNMNALREDIINVHKVLEDTKKNTKNMKIYEKYATQKYMYCALLL